MLIVYFVDFGVTQVVVPLPLQSYLGELVDLGPSIPPPPPGMIAC